MKKSAALFSLLFALAACESEQQPAPMAASGGLPPKIALDVQTISLADRSGLQSPNSPYNGNHFTPTIDEAIKQWASDRLQAAGQSGQAIFIIKDASLVAQALPLHSGINYWFTRQQATKYIARAEVSFEANGQPGFATADATATRAVTLPEDPTPEERQDAYYSLLNGLMKDLGQNLEAAIASHMTNFIANAPNDGNAASGNMSGNAPMPVDIQPANASIDTAPVTTAPMPMTTAPSSMNAPMPATPMMPSAPAIQIPAAPTMTPPQAPTPSYGSYGKAVIPLSVGSYGH